MASPAPQAQYGHHQQQGAHEERLQRPMFNQEELRVLRECNRESFYFRSVPLAAAFSAAAFLAMRKGLLKVNERFGYSPKMFAGAVIGYFVGKLSYQNACAEKLMQLADSPIGEALRRRKGRLGFQESLGMEPGFTVADPSSSSGQTPTDLMLYEDPRTDIRDHNEGLVDYERGVAQSLSQYTENEDGSSVSPQKYTTYEDLRRQNRHDYIMKKFYRKDKPADPIPEGGGPHGMDEPPVQPSPSYRPPPPAPPPPRHKKNQYGDDVYE